MLNILEKVQYGFCGLVLFLVLLRYVIWGAPEIRSVDTLPGMKVTRPQTVAETAAKDTASSGGTAAEQAERQNLENKLVEKGLSRNVAKAAEKVAFQVPQETFEYLKKKDNWVPELNKAASSIIAAKDGQNSILELTSIEAGSLIEKIGFQSKDQIYLLNGQSMAFDPGNSYDYMKKADQWIDDLKKGKKFTISVLRNGRVVNMEFKL